MFRMKEVLILVKCIINLVAGKLFVYWIIVDWIFKYCYALLYLLSLNGYSLTMNSCSLNGLILNVIH
jgi:hypothetical protein